MLYYKVKPQSDQTRTSFRRKFDILIANEIYTDRFIEKQIKAGKINEIFVNRHFTKENINPKNTYWFFGARFQLSTDTITN